MNHTFEEYGRIALRQCLRILFQLFRFLPVRKNRILFSSFKGRDYSCNPKYICEYLIRHEPSRFEIIWAFQNPSAFSLAKHIKTVKYLSLRYFYYCMTSGAIITNVGAHSFLPNRPEQFIINTWHGGGAYKRVGYSFYKNPKDHKLWGLKKQLENTDLFLSSNNFFSSVILHQDFHYYGKILNCGMPRNDILINVRQRTAMAEHLRKKLNLTGYLILYAPTFRGDKDLGYIHKLSVPFAQISSVLQDKKKQPVCFLLRAHPGCRLPASAALPCNVINVSAGFDMQELLCAADMLITDYSSCIWDFALTGRPCLLYVPDRKEYETDRGICTPMEEWPGILCEKEDALIEAVKTLDETQCAQKAADHLRALGSYETGTASKQVCEWILQHIKK